MNRSMATIQARISKELEDYLEDIVSSEYAKNKSEAIRLIILERMIADNLRGAISPFRYAQVKGKRSRKKRSLKIEIIKREELPSSEDAPHGPGEPLRGEASIPTGSSGDYWNGPKIGSELSEEELEIMRRERPELVKYQKGKE